MVGTPVASDQGEGGQGLGSDVGTKAVQDLILTRSGGGCYTPPLNANLVTVLSRD